jgi:adenylosuccinate synthase
MAQAVGLDPWLGTLPDVTSSNTTLWGIAAGTGFLRPTDIADRIGIFKITYTSSVGARKMPTHATDEWADWTRTAADEYGTTTRRPRDILYLDLDLLRFNARMGGIEVLAGTHLDITQEEQPIKVCTHYEVDGKRVPYQPGLRYLQNVQPKYIELPGWDGKKAASAKSFDGLPDNAKKFLAFVQKMTGFPIVVATNGPKRESLLAFSGYDYQVKKD